jgi:type I restriction enzyme R subunit
VAAVKPFSDPELRQLILKLRQKADLVVDTVTQDTLLHAGFSEAAKERAKGMVQSFEQFIAQHKDEITALQILYNRPTGAPLKYSDIKALADALRAPPHLMDESQLWQAYAALNQTKVKGTSQRRLLTDLVSLVRFAMQQDNELVPYPERVNTNYKAWLAQQETAQPISSVKGISSLPLPLGEGRGEGVTHSRFTPEQLHWLDMIRDHIAANLGIESNDFEYAPFDAEGGLGKVHQLFGAELPKVMEELNRELVA